MPEKEEYLGVLGVLLYTLLARLSETYIDSK
jgi:hypothetical protein